MKKIIIIIAFIAPLFSKAQDDEPKKGIQEVSVGCMFTGSLNSQMMLFGTIAPSLNIEIWKINSHFMYELTTHSIQTLNGYSFSKEWEIFVFAQTDTKGTEKYVGTGIAYSWSPSPSSWFTMICSAEVGTNFPETVVTCGLTLHPHLNFLKLLKKR